MNITDDILDEVIMLEKIIKRYQMRINEIKETCKKRGSFMSNRYLVAISSQTRAAYQVPETTFKVCKIIPRELALGKERRT